MKRQSEIFVESNLVGLDGGPCNLSVDEDWKVRLDAVAEPLNFEPEAAVCLSAIMSLASRLTTVNDREDAIVEVVAESVTRGMPVTKFITTGLDELEAAKQINSTRKLYERDLLRSTSPLHPHLYSVGYARDKRLFFCTNVASLDYGLDNIDGLFSAEDERVKKYHQKDFERLYTRRRPTQPPLNQKKHDFVESETPTITVQSTLILPQKRTDSSNIIDPLTRRQKGNKKRTQSAVDTAASLKRVAEFNEVGMLEELLGKYSPLDDYRSELVGFISALQDGTIIKESDLKNHVESLGYTPNPADIDRVIRSCHGKIKKTLLKEPRRPDVVAFKKI